MRFLVPVGVAVAIAASSAAFAEPVTRTVTFDTPRYDGTRTTTRDREAGSLERDTVLTRSSDGAVAIRSYDRQRTDTGASLSGSTTRFNGDTRSFDAERTRTARGHRTEGGVTGFNGERYAYHAAGRRTPNGFVRRQGLRDSDGDLVAGRRIAVRRGPHGGTVRRISRFGRR
jgi:hypothetical protein